jgi:uncharacterized membrane protein
MLLAISLPADQTAREMLTLLEVAQGELLPSPEDACLVTRDAHGDVRLRQSVYVTPRGAAGTFWNTLVQRLLDLRERRTLSGSTDALVNVLRPSTSTLLVVTRTEVASDRVIALANAVGGHVLHMQLSRQSEFALSLLAGLRPATQDAA